MKYSRAKNTIKAYDHGWKKFTRWCAEFGKNALPAEPATVLDFVTCRVEQGNYRLGTIRNELHSIQFQHGQNSLESPVDKSVRDLVRSAARKLREQPRGKRALTPAHLKAIGKSLRGDDSAMAKRDHAMVLLGFAVGWRRSELA
jgi:site-specific recombinase XerD